MSNRQIFILVVVAVVAIIGYASVFVVNERELAIKFRLGEIVKSDYEPGIYGQIPFVNNVIKFEKRILTLDVRPTEYLTNEKKRLVVDFFAKWRINDVEKFYRTMSGGDMNTAKLRIFNIINNGLKSQFSKYNLKELVSGVRTVELEEGSKELKDLRAHVMQTITRQANAQVEKYGISIVDIRIKRIDLTKKISNAVFSRMKSERQQFAADIRSRGKEQAERLRADADRQRTIILANAYKTAQELRGEGDARAADIYAIAYNKDREFYSFYRSLDAYKKSFEGRNDILVLEPDSDFFDYFKQNKPKR
ncbi:MAG: protease modulator HflC [Thioalkalispiraceae bacterium]|jgi:membrane protease subunit HflC